jgi:putative ABC transport system permease protein
VLKNYLAAAFRNLARGKLYASISIFGLALGLCATLLVALILRNQYGYEHFVAGYDRVYLVVSTLIPQQREPDYNEASFSEIAALLKLRFPEIESAARLAARDVVLRHGNVSAKEIVYWADPDVFAVMPMPVVAGDLRAALRRPDGIVLPRSIARKYFGRDTPIGEALQVADGNVMTVTAVIEDLPDHGTRLRSGIFASGLASWSALTQLDSDPANRLSNPGGMSVTVMTYLRLAPGGSIERLQAAMPAFLDGVLAFRVPGLRVTLTLVRLDEAHLFHGFNPGAHGRLAMSIAVGLVILLIACINFVNLTTARASRRAREVMVRKVAGASRGTLVAQFLGETFIYVALAMCMALALTELLLPHVNAFVNGGAKLDYAEHPLLIGWIALGALLLSAIGGFYPALVLSSFQPARVLKGQLAHSHGANRARQVLVSLQFALLIALIFSAIVVYQQRNFATREALRVATDQHLVLRTPCREALKTSLRNLPGVRDAACVSNGFLNGAEFSNVRLVNGVETALGGAGVEPGTLEQFDLVPLAGRFFTTADAVSRTHVVINESAVRRLGFDSPAAAIGKALPIENPDAGPTEIIGVVRDFALYSVEREIAPTVYTRRDRYELMDVKLTGQKIPETLAALERLWKATGAADPPVYFFLSDYVQALYVSVLRFAQAFGIFSAIAVMLACLGLIGLSASITDRRRKEIGVRKAMGAGTASILRLLLWQFTKPVLWAALIAWPLSAWLMSRWLDGFAYHVDLSPLPFFASAVLTLCVALLTVSAHSYSVARSQPVQALRHE